MIMDNKCQCVFVECVYMQLFSQASFFWGGGGGGGGGEVMRITNFHGK